MNTTIAAVRRRIAFCAAAAIVFPAFTACGTEIAPPAQDITHVTQDQQHRSAPMPTRTTGNRFTFGDEYGQARVKAHRAHRAQSAGGGTRNRMDFRDDGR